MPHLTSFRTVKGGLVRRVYYGSFLSKLDLDGTILCTMLTQNCPKGKRQWLNQSNLLFPDGQH